jgi:hypothetical protein
LSVLMDAGVGLVAGAIIFAVVESIHKIRGYQ